MNDVAAEFELRAETWRDNAGEDERMHRDADTRQEFGYCLCWNAADGRLATTRNERQETIAQDGNSNKFQGQPTEGATMDWPIDRLNGEAWEASAHPF